MLGVKSVKIISVDLLLLNNKIIYQKKNDTEDPPRLAFLFYYTYILLIVPGSTLSRRLFIHSNPLLFDVFNEHYYYFID